MASRVATRGQSFNFVTLVTHIDYVYNKNKITVSLRVRYADRSLVG